MTVRNCYCDSAWWDVETFWEISAAILSSHRRQLGVEGGGGDVGGGEIRVWNPQSSSVDLKRQTFRFGHH